VLPAFRAPGTRKSAGLQETADRRFFFLSVRSGANFDVR
jgi:hypothetical protein